MLSLNAVDREDVVFLTLATFCFNTCSTHDCLDCLKNGKEKQSVFARCSHYEGYYCFNNFFIPADLSLITNVKLLTHLRLLS